MFSLYLFVFYIGLYSYLCFDIYPQATQQHKIGAIYFAYHPNLTRAMTYLNRSTTSVQSIKKFHPQLQITLISNVNISKSDLAAQGFNSQVHISQNHLVDARQWWTRMMYLNHTPYEYTLSIDSDRVVCSDISEGFDILINGYKGKSYVLLEVSAGIVPAFDNGVMFFRKGWKFNQLVEIWMRFQSAWNKHGDDQFCLASALEYIRDKKKSPMKNFNVGILPPTWQAKYIPAVGQNWGAAKASRTLVMSGEIKIVASTSCHVFEPVNDTRKRIYTHNRVDGQVMDGRYSVVVYSHAECDKQLWGKCNHTEIDWKGARYHVLDRQEYLGRYYHKAEVKTSCSLKPSRD